MVTHNPELAEKYASRIVRFQDGRVISDTNPYNEMATDNSYQLKKTKMSFGTALKLSGTNIATKKWRTALTAFASSIGIIGIALVLSLSTGFKEQIAKFQNEAMTNMPIMITRTSISMDAESMRSRNDQAMSVFDKNKPYATTDYVTTYNPNENFVQHINKITQDYLDYINKIDPSICSNIGYTRMVGMNLLRENDGKAYPVSVPVGINMGNDEPSQMNSMANAGLSSYPETLGDNKSSYLETNYDLLAGSYPKSETDMVLIVDNQNRVATSTLKNIGYDVSDSSHIKFTDIVGTEFKLISNNDFYTKTEMGNFMPNNNYTEMYDDKDNITL
jgi:putative ABC transport system permease protein